MPSKDLLEEVEWQLSFGMHPLYISQAMNKSVEAICKAAYRAGNRVVMNEFSKASFKERKTNGGPR